MMVQNPDRVICPYDVGDVLITASAVQPSARWPGTSWTQIKDCFLLAAGDSHEAGSTGGEEAHTLTSPEMPSHAHYERLDFSGFGVRNLAASPGTGEGGGKVFQAENAGSSTSEYYVQTETAGGGGAHNNMPPFKAFFMWQRMT